MGGRYHRPTERAQRDTTLPHHGSCGRRPADTPLPPTRECSHTYPPSRHATLTPPHGSAAILLQYPHVDLRCARSAIFFKDFDFLGRGSSKFRSPAGASAEQDLGLGAWLSKSWKKSWVLIASLSLGTRSSSFLPILRLGVRARRRERRRCGARGVPDTTLPPWTVLTPAVGGYPPTPYPGLPMIPTVPPI